MLQDGVTAHVFALHWGCSSPCMGMLTHPPLSTPAGKAAHWAYKEVPAGTPPPPPLAPAAGDLAAASSSSSDEGDGPGLEPLGIEAGHPLLHIKGAQHTLC